MCVCGGGGGGGTINGTWSWVQGSVTIPIGKESHRKCNWLSRQDIFSIGMLFHTTKSKVITNKVEFCII